MKHRVAPKRRQVNVRIAAEVYDRIQREAAEQKRSVSAQVALVIERALEPARAEAAR